MHIQLADVLFGEEGRPIHYEIPVERESVEVGGVCFALSEKSPAILDIVRTDGQTVKIEGSCQVSAKIPCGRCLREVETPFKLAISREVDMEKPEEERIQELDGANFITGTKLDVEQLICNELLAQWPMRVLCKEDCKGLCSRCGADLNVSPCDCDRTSLDPRMAAISDIFSRFKEE